MKLTRKTALIGAGGMANEIYWILKKDGYVIKELYDNFQEENGAVKNKINDDLFYLMAVGYPETKQKIIQNLQIPWNLAFISSLAFIGGYIEIEIGSVVYPFVTIHGNTYIEKLATINSNVIIGHDCQIGEMFHACPGAIVSGNVNIGHRVFLGANSTVKEKITICNDVIIGAGAVVTKDITEPGKYAGVPAKKI